MNALDIYDFGVEHIILGGMGSVSANIAPSYVNEGFDHIDLSVVEDEIKNLGMVQVNYIMCLICIISWTKGYKNGDKFS